MATNFIQSDFGVNKTNASHIGGNLTYYHVIGRFEEGPEAISVPFIFGIIFILGVAGNGILIFTVAANRGMRSRPNIFIVSLAVGDLLLILVSVPFTATFYTFTEWPYGTFMCKLNEFLHSLSLGVSIFTLTALSGERYLVIVFPITQRRNSSMLRTVVIALGIWVFSFCLALLEVIAANTRQKVYGTVVLEICNAFPPEWGDWYEKFHTVFQFVVYFAVPVTVIMIFYSLMAKILFKGFRAVPSVDSREHESKQFKARKKVAKLVLAFVFVFIACWLPRHVYLFWYHFDPGRYSFFWHVFKITGFCLCFINSCVNPVALCILSRQFRGYFIRYIRCRCSCHLVALHKRQEYTASSLPPHYKQKMRPLKTPDTGLTGPSLL